MPSPEAPIPSPPARSHASESETTEPKRAGRWRHRRGNLRLVEDNAPAEATEERLAGLSRETLRDQRAIQVFIDTRDTLYAGGRGLPLDEALTRAAAAYDAVLELPLDNWGIDPVEHGLYRLNSAGAPIRPAPSSTEFIQAAGLEDRWNSDDEYGSDSLGAYRYISRGHGPKGSDEKGDIDTRSDAIVASYEARDRALADGKTIEEAQAIGEKVWKIDYGMGDAVSTTSAEQQRATRESGVKISPEGYREAAAIGAFKEQRDIPVREGMQHGESERGWALHLAVGEYKKVLEKPLEYFERPVASESSQASPSPAPAEAKSLAGGGSAGDDPEQPTPPADPEETSEEDDEQERPAPETNTTTSPQSPEEIAKAENKQERKRPTSETAKKFLRKTGREAILYAKMIGSKPVRRILLDYMRHEVVDDKIIAPLASAIETMESSVKSVPGKLAGQYREVVKALDDRVVGELGRLLSNLALEAANRRRVRKDARKERRNEDDKEILRRVANMLDKTNKKHIEGPYTPY